MSWTWRWDRSTSGAGLSASCSASDPNFLSLDRAPRGSARWRAVAFLFFPPHLTPQVSSLFQGNEPMLRKTEPRLIRFVTDERPIEPGHVRQVPGENDVPRILIDDVLDPLGRIVRLKSAN